MRVVFSEPFRRNSECGGFPRLRGLASAGRAGVPDDAGDDDREEHSGEEFPHGVVSFGVDCLGVGCRPPRCVSGDRRRGARPCLGHCAACRGCGWPALIPAFAGDDAVQWSAARLAWWTPTSAGVGCVQVMAEFDFNSAAGASPNAGGGERKARPVLWDGGVPEMGRAGKRTWVASFE